MSTTVIGNKAKKAAALAGVSAAVVFLGLDTTITSLAVGAVRPVLPTSLYDPLSMAAIVFVSSMFFDMFMGAGAFGSFGGQF